MSEKAIIEYKVDGEIVKLSPSIVQNFIMDPKSSKITMQEYFLFAKLCEVRKLNPFIKEAYLVKFGSLPATMIVGKDAILKRAIKHPDYDGRQQGIIVMGESGETIYKDGACKNSGEKLLGGWAKVYRKNWKYPTFVTVSFEEAAQRKADGNLNSNWQNKGATMVEKVAVVRALRETFIEELGGMYEREEVLSYKDSDIIDADVDLNAIFDSDIEQNEKELEV